MLAVMGPVYFCAADPAWWTEGSSPVITSNSGAGNHGAANVGQAKWMAKVALDKIRTFAPELADKIQTDLTQVVDLSVPPTPSQEWFDQQKAPLLVGQLKAISKSFYDWTHVGAPAWLEVQLNTNQTKDSGDAQNFYPWTSNLSDDANHSVVNIGQLKAVFGFDLATLESYCLIDTDQDGFNDWYELIVTGTDPNVSENPDQDGDGLPDAWEIQYFGNLDHGPSEDPDGDFYTNAQEFLRNTSPIVPNLEDSDADGLPDGWETYYFGSKEYTNGSGNQDNDWFTNLEEYQNGTDPTLNDDVDLDGWLDRDESQMINHDLTDAIKRPSDILPWADLDGDGIANACEISEGTDPFSNTDPVSTAYAPLIKLVPSHFNGSGSTAVWSNDGRLGGVFTSEVSKPSLTTKSSMPAVELLATSSSWMVGPTVSPWMNGSGSRTVVAWVYNSTVSTTENDVLFSWGASSTGTTPTLFSCRYGASLTNGAIAQGGLNAPSDHGWKTSYQPTAGSWSFVVYRYNSADGTLFAMRDFSVGFMARNSFLQTGIFDTTSKLHKFILGGDNQGNGTRDSTLKSGLCIGELQVFDRAVSISEIINTIYNPSRASYGKSSLLDSDGDGLPDLMETSLGLNPNSNDSDQDGVEDGDEFIAGQDPGDFFNGEPHYVSITQGNNQKVWTGEQTDLPIKYKVMDINSDPIQNAPVHVSIISPSPANGLIGTATPSATTLSTRTDTNGEVSVSFKANAN